MYTPGILSLKTIQSGFYTVRLLTIPTNLGYLSKTSNRSPSLIKCMLGFMEHCKLFYQIFLSLSKTFSWRHEYTRLLSVTGTPKKCFSTPKSFMRN